MTQLTLPVHEFNAVIQDFCAAFVNPKIKNLSDIIQYNKDHADVAMPERKPLKKTKKEILKRTR